LASFPCRFTPGERASDTRRLGGLVSPRNGLDYVKREKSYPAPTPRLFSPYPVAVQTQLSQVTEIFLMNVDVIVEHFKISSETL
jgi:hypothetical protein